MRTELFIKSYRADADVVKHRLVKAGAADTTIAQATAASSAIMGVADSLGGKAGKVMDVITGGYASVEYGASITRGQPLTSDADGKAVVPTLGGQRIVGFAVTSGDSGDIGTVAISLGVMGVADT